VALKKTENKPDVQVDETPVTPDETTVETTPDTSAETPPAVETPDPSTPPVEVEIPEEPKSSDVEVNPTDIGAPTVEVPTKKQNADVKVRMRCDHRCTIAMVRYDLKADKVYVVPANVKRILNDAGLLAPL